MLVFGGDLAGAASAVSENASVEQATGIRAAPYGALILAAWRGTERETVDLIGTTEHDVRSRGEGIGLAICSYARAVLSNGLARYEEAFLAAVDASEHREIVAENWGLSELVEAATRSGHHDVADDATARLAVKAAATRSDWALGVEARARALTAGPADVEACYRASIEHLGRTFVKAELARTHLLYGEWLRRQNRRRDAREQLDTARAMFVSAGMEAFTQRTDNELMGIGEARSSAAARPDALTQQERQIAELARDGLTNPQIGGRLFLSPRTVEWHLRHVYTKLDIRSRRELAKAL
jgi:ATP/maltotriose-dependent transcriptional regulator MalT